MPLKHALLSATLLALAAIPAAAVADPVQMRVLTDADAAKMLADPATAKEADNLVVSDGFRVALKVRNKPGKVENHADWDDALIIQDGTVLVNYGGTTVNEHPTKAPGETIGDAITGGKSVTMHPGDIMIIPSGMPHQMLIQTPTMRYIAVKTKKSPDATFKFISAADAAKMAFDPASAQAAARINGGPAFKISLSKRIESGHPEKHATANETLFIQEGDVTLNYGGTGTGTTEPGPGEMRGTSIAGAKTARLHPGDIVVIPADTWHEQVLHSPRMRYVLIKSNS